MKKYSLLLLFLICNICFVSAQVDKKYLAGAVPEVDGKVTFKRILNVDKSIPEAKLKSLVKQWAEQEYASNEKTKRRILLEKDNYIICQGDDELVFKSSVFMLDKADVNYRLMVSTDLGVCTIEMMHIRYEYQDYDKPQSAEVMITDEVALHKNGDKLNRHYDKFRTKTIDLVEEIEKKLAAFLNDNLEIKIVEEPKAVVAVSSAPVVAKSSAVIPATPLTSAKKTIVPVASTSTQGQIVSSTPTSIAMVPLTPITPMLGMDGYRNIDPEKIPGNIIKMLKDDWSLVMSGKADKPNVMTASWGGLGRFWEKSVSMSFINPTRHTISTMNEGDTYTISFYTEVYRDVLNYCGSNSGKSTDKIKGAGLTLVKTPSGAPAFSEAWLIIECKKVLSQPISDSAIIDRDAAKEWSKDGNHKIYIGEILNVWVK